jgi:hypothetical protein
VAVLFAKSRKIWTQAEDTKKIIRETRQARRELPVSVKQEGYLRERTSKSHDRHVDAGVCILRMIIHLLLAEPSPPYARISRLVQEVFADCHV